MTSVNTNVAAITALRTLQQTNNQLDSTQGRISTGLKIGEAKDNAAYWAISTTLKSDNKSLATVKDALGLGSATVDVAYQGLNKTKDVLDEIKAKLTAASQAGVDKNVIQAEIGELQKQLVSIAGSSVFSGENWLSVDSSAVDYDSTKKIVASFARDANNSVTIGTVDVSIGNVALFDSSNVMGKNGILDGVQSLVGKDGRNLTIGGTLSTTGNVNTGGVANVAVSGQLATGNAGSITTNGTDAVASDTVAGNTTDAGKLATGTVNLTDVADGDKISFKVKVNGGAVQTFTLTKDATYSISNLGTKLQAELTAQNVSNFSVSSVATPDRLLFSTGTAASTSTFQLADVVVTDAAGRAKNLTNAVLGAAADFKKGNGATYTTSATAQFAGSIAEVYTSASLTGTAWNTKFAADDQITVNMTIDGKSVSSTVAAGATVGDFISNLNNNGNFAASAKASGTSTLVVTSGSTGLTGSTVSFDSVTFKTAAGAVKTVSSSGFENIGQAASTTTATFVPLALDADDKVMFDIKLNDATGAKTVTIDKALIDKTLKTTDGKVTLIADYKKVFDAALTAAGVSGVATTANASTLTVATTTESGANAKIAITGSNASNGGAQISVDKIDISDAGLAALNVSSGEDISKVLSAYISVVNTAINKVTTAASNLGAVASRIDMQKSFVNTLMDTIDKGVGGLIDADMSEESTKLQALQVKQSLGVQALSIANQSSQNILRLFQ